MAIGRVRTWLFTAMLIDALGSGLLGPFDLLYGHTVTRLPLWLAGLALSMGTAIAIPLGPIAGVLVDRMGVVRVTLVANALSALGCGLLLAARDVWMFGVAVAVLAGGSRIFWASFSPLVAAIAGSGRQTWFGRIRSLRYAGLTGGQALAGLILLLGAVRGLQILVAGDAVSFIVALVLVGLVPGGVAAPRRVAIIRSKVPAGYRAALRDRTNVLLAGLNVLATLILTLPLLGLPILVVDQLRLALWMPGVLAALNTAAVAVPAFFAGRLLQGRRSLQILAASALMWMLAAGFLGIGSVSHTLAYAALPIGVILLGLGEAGYAPTADGLPLDLAPPQLAGRYAALHQMAWGISGAIAPAITAILIGSGHTSLWLATGVLALILAVSYRLVEPVVTARLTSTRAS